jgi:antitoxin PrlF
MKVTMKGQVTIPIALRERFGFSHGTEVEFFAAEGFLQMKPRKKIQETPSAFDLWLSKAAGSAKPGKTTDEFMAMTRGED